MILYSFNISCLNSSKHSLCIWCGMVKQEETQSDHELSFQICHCFTYSEQGTILFSHSILLVIGYILHALLIRNLKKKMSMISAKSEYVRSQFLSFQVQIQKLVSSVLPLNFYSTASRNFQTLCFINFQTLYCRSSEEKQTKQAIILQF